MPRPQFTLRALLVAMLIVAAFFGGMAVQRQREKSKLWWIQPTSGPHWRPAPH